MKTDFLEILIRVDALILIPLALIGLVVAVVLLILRRKKNGARPPHAKGMLIAALLLFAFAALVLVVIPVLYCGVMLIKLLLALLYPALKSL